MSRLKRLLSFDVQGKMISIGILPVILFLLMITIFILPTIEDNIFDERRTQVQEMVNAGLGVLEHYHEQELRGELSREEAQMRARAVIGSMLYGPGNQDYFWINDFEPVMVMHPFVQELEGQDLYNYADPEGTYLFREMVTVCRRDGSGFVPYLWQYYDDEARIEPKISYVASFDPWEWILGTGIYTNDVQEIVSSSRNIVLILVFGITGLVLVSTYFLSSNLVKPLNLVVNSLINMADNLDLTEGVGQDIVGRSDAIGRLGKSYNKMVGDFRKTIQRVMKSAGEVEEASRNISDSTGNLSEGIENQAGSMEELTATMEEMNASIQEVADNVQQTSEHSENVSTSILEMNKSLQEVAENLQIVTSETEKSAQAAERMNKGAEESSEEARNTEKDTRETMEITRAGQEQIKKTIAEMESINESVQGLARVIGDLGGSAGRIGEIVETIDDIAEQTNLLALNAAIEAARAGEHGKGFAVVAGAIGDLAEKSQEATKDIANLVVEIQDEVQKAVETSNEGSSKVEQGVTMVQDAGTAFERIYKAVENVTKRMEVIVNNIVEQENQSSQVRASAEKISNLIQDLSAAAEEQSASTEEMVKLVEKMSELARDVAAATEEQAASNDEVVKTAENVSEVTTENSASSEEIASAGDHLKKLAGDLKEMVDQFQIAE